MMPGAHWTPELEALLKRAGRIYADAKGMPQWRLVVACEPWAAERGYDAIRVKGANLGAIEEASGGLRYDAAPEAVVEQIHAIVNAPGTRSTMPPLMQVEGTPGIRVTPASDGSKAVRFVGRHLTTEQEIREQAGLSRERWECVTFEYSDHQVPMKGEGDEPDTVMTMHRAFAKFKPRTGYDELADFREAILADIAAHAPMYPKWESPEESDDPHLLEFSPFDLHIGKLAWEQETGTDYDTAIAESLLMQATEDVLRKVRGFPIARVLFPLGNDLFNADNPEGQTARGTPQDMDSRSERVKDRAESLLVHVIDRLASVAPVDVFTVPGNHDRDAAQWMGRVLRAWYKNTDRVTVDCGPRLRKYKRWGPALIGFTHGSEEKHRDLPLIMATEEPAAWAECSQREFHVGHFHKRKETVYSAGDSFNGVRVRVLPSLSGTDAWHAEQGYVKNWRAVESYLWSERSGYVGHLSSNVTTANGQQRIAA